MEALAYADTYQAIESAGDNVKMKPTGELAELVEQIEIAIAEANKSKKDAKKTR